MVYACTVALLTLLGCHHGHGRSTILGQLIMAVALGGTGGPLGAWMVRVCPPETRFSSVAVGYNMALAVFGGTAPLAGAALMRAVDSTASPGACVPRVVAPGCRAGCG